MDTQDIKYISADLGDAVLMSNDPNLFTGKIQIHECGRQYRTLYTKKFMERKKWKAPDLGEVRSIIPGSVTDICVREGEKVKKGTCLMIYEAMKMKNRILAPFDATVKTIEVSVGAKLPKGALLVTLSSFTIA